MFLAIFQSDRVSRPQVKIAAGNSSIYVCTYLNSSLFYSLLRRLLRGVVCRRKGGGLEKKTP